jgi:tetratricopeptide (TPR) repeat protein
MKCMIKLYAKADLVPQLQAIIDQEFRLNELVQVVDLLKENPAPTALNLIVRAKSGLNQVLDWHNLMPPYLLPEEIEFSSNNLLAVLYAKLGNYERAYDLLQGNQVLLNEIDIINCLQNGIPADPNRLTSDFNSFEEYRFCHNSAILYHYAATEESFDPDRAHYFYREALNSSPNGEYHAFTARQFAIFLIDAGDLLRAEHLLEDAIVNALSDDAVLELKATQVGIWMKKLVAPYDPVLLENLKNTLWEVLQHYQKQGRSLEESLLLIDAAQVANYSESFTESLGYINRAIDILRGEDMLELLAQAQYRRGVLLYTWAKNDNPQFFRPAQESFQAALKVFSKDAAPDVFADIHQYLGVIYAEIPDEIKKKSIWAGVSSASFQEALAFFTKEIFPYEYAMVCNNYANALSKYPAAVHSDNLEKAVFYYAQALEVRTAADWPLERAVTLLNYVETCWFLNLQGNGSNRALYEQMQHMVQEAASLSEDTQIQASAAEQMERLHKLKQALEVEAAQM